MPDIKDACEGDKGGGVRCLPVGCEVEQETGDTGRGWQIPEYQYVTVSSTVTNHGCATMTRLKKRIITGQEL